MRQSCAAPRLAAATNAHSQQRVILGGASVAAAAAPAYIKRLSNFVLIFQPVMQSSSARSALACAGGFLRGKFSPRQGRSNNLSPKHGPHNYYKGNGCPSLGNITKKGKFIVDWDKVPQLMVPNISVSKIKPYVTYATEKPAAEKSSP